MRRILFSLAAIAIVAAGSLSAQQRRWTISVEGGFGSAWNETRVGDKFTFYQNEQLGSLPTLDYGVHYVPLVAKGGAGSSFRLEVLSSNAEAAPSLAWGVAFSRVSSRGSIRARVTSPEDGSAFRGCRMWGYTIFTVYNELEPSLASPADCWGENKNSYWTGDLFGLLSLLESDEVGLSLTAGVRLAGVTQKEVIGQGQASFIYGAFGQDASGEWVHGQNDITLQSTSSSSFGLLGGPSFGARIRFSTGRVSARLALTQSVLFGEALLRGRWTDVDSIYEMRGPFGGPFVGGDPVVKYNGDFTSAMTHRSILPVSEANLRVTYAVRRNVSVGVSGFLSLWSNVPQPQTWEMGGFWSLEGATGFRQSVGSRAFAGVRAVVEYQY